MTDAQSIFMNWLESAVARIKDFETEISKTIAADDDAAYKEALLAKAGFLADLAENAGRGLAGLPEDAGAFARERLEGFAESAGRALEIGSYFYMSALLYPEEHKPGEPNDLDLFAARMRELLGG